MKIVLVEPRSPDLHIFSVFKLPRLGIVLLGTILDLEGHEVSVQIEDIEPLDLDELGRADMVLISAITATAPRSYSLSRKLREEGTVTVLGGPHVTYLPEEALEHTDYVVCGEGEQSVVPLVRAVESQRGFESVPGLMYRKSGVIHRNPPAPLLPDLDENPCPDFSLIRGWSGEGLFKKLVPVQTSRGCPFGCSFCSVTGMFGRKIRLRSIDKVIEEMKSLRDTADHVFFYDDNFTANRARTKELLSRMIEEKVHMSWSAQVRVDVAGDAELMDLMKRSECTRVYVGFETIDPETLRVIQKDANLDDAEKALRELSSKRGIDVHGMFVIGFDGDTSESVRSTVDWALDNGVKTAQFLILTPFPGSAYFEQAGREGRILIRDWGYYDTHHVITRPRSMTPFELQRAQVDAHARFYSAGALARHLVHLDFQSMLVGIHARRINRAWLRANSDFLKLAELLSIEPRGRAFEIGVVSTYDDF